MSNVYLYFDYILKFNKDQVGQYYFDSLSCFKSDVKYITNLSADIYIYI